MRIIVFIACLTLSMAVSAQGTYIPLGSYSMHLLDRFEIKSGRLAEPQEFNTATRAYQRHRIASYVDSFDVVGAGLSKQDYFNLGYLQDDNFEFSQSESTRSRIRTPGVYKYKAAFYGLKTNDFKLALNPVTILMGGNDSRAGRLATLNSRGVEIRGAIGNKFGFYTTFNDEIIRMNSWVYDYFKDYGAVPGAGFWKWPASHTDTFPPYNTNYSTASGYIVYQPSEYFDVQFGHGRNFLGNGYRTFYMSDFSRDHLFLRVNTRVWKINYTNIWGELFHWAPPNQKYLIKRHYYATTYANVNLSRSFNLGLFQTISFQRDSGYTNNGYDLQYLNPIIFFKPIENGLNSPDKSILGADFKWNFLRHFQLYGQAVISEFKIAEILADNGWFGNKWATQIGLKYIDAFAVKNLDLQMESNIARPYMYTSFNALNAYVNYNQNMAHPLGANFYENIAIIRYQPVNRLMIKATFIYAVYGNDTNGSNWGKDIRTAYSNTSLPKLYGNTIAQGVKTSLLSTDLLVSWMVRHNLFVDLQLLYRKTDSDLPVFVTQTIYAGAGIRWNMSERRWDF